jgi:hypothetical protein
MTQQLYKAEFHIQVERENDPPLECYHAFKLIGDVRAWCKERGLERHLINAYMNPMVGNMASVVVVLDDRDTAVMVKLALA